MRAKTAPHFRVRWRCGQLSHSTGSWRELPRKCRWKRGHMRPASHTRTARATAKVSEACQHLRPRQPVTHSKEHGVNRDKPCLCKKSRKSIDSLLCSRADKFLSLRTSCDGSHDRAYRRLPHCRRGTGQAVRPVRRVARCDGGV